MSFLLLLLYIILSLYYIYYCYNKYNNYPIKSLFLPFIVSSITLLSQELYEYTFLFLVSIGLVSILILILFHFIFNKNSILHIIHHRYFYVFCIIIYMYILVLLSCRSERSAYQNTIAYPSVLLIILCLSSFLIKGTIKDYMVENYRKIPSFRSVSLLFFIQLISYYLTKRISLFSNIDNIIFLYSLVLSIPLQLVFFYLFQNQKYEIIVSRLIELFLLPFFLLGLLDFLWLKDPIYFHHNLLIIKELKFGLYTSSILLIPTIKKFRNSFFYNILIIIILIMGICILT